MKEQQKVARPCDTSQIGIVVLAAGLSTRFGREDKLAAGLRGKPVAHHVLKAIETFDWGNRLLVCSQDSLWTAPYREAGFGIIENAERDSGMLSSLHLGSSANQELPYTMICLADMPFIDRDTLSALILEVSAENVDACASRSGTYKGPPAIFRTQMLLALPKEGEGGARQLLANARFIDCSAHTLQDIDTQADLLAAQVDD